MIMLVASDDPIRKKGSTLSLCATCVNLMADSCEREEPQTRHDKQGFVITYACRGYRKETRTKEQLVALGAAIPSTN